MLTTKDQMRSFSRIMENMFAIVRAFQIAFLLDVLFNLGDLFIIDENRYLTGFLEVEQRGEEGG